MEDIKVDFKLIIITICISALIGTLIWAGYNLYVELTKDENEGIEYFEGDMTSNIDNNSKIVFNENKIDFNISDIIGEDGFEINNINVEPKKDGWVKRICNFTVAGHKVMYYIPSDWTSEAGTDKKNGVTINAHILKIDNLTQETTYEEFLNKFIETIESKEYYQQVENYSKRPININGETFYILVKEQYYNAIHSYFCLAKDEYAYYLETIASKENYNQELINSVDEIFATFSIY